MSVSLWQTWDLDTFYEGGSRSPALASHLQALADAINALGGRVGMLRVPNSPQVVTLWHETLESLQDIESGLHHVGSFAGCLISQDVRDEEAKLLWGRINQMRANLDAVTNQLDRQILEVPEPLWQALLADERLAPIRFPLQERRLKAADKLSPAQETLISDLSVDGFHSWETMYETIVGRIRVPFVADGREEVLSASQAINRFSHPDRGVRKDLFDRWQEAWMNEADLLSQVLNHLSGFRLNLYRHRGWESILKECLVLNRMSEATLWAMWEAVVSAKQALVSYLQRKARLLGCEKLAWYDLTAPLGVESRKIDYDEAVQFILEQFRSRCPGMASFASQAVRNRWLEVEDRPFKGSGGYCTSFPLARQSRIFMTFGGDTQGVGTLAHELGHAYHAHVTFDLPYLVQEYPVNLAETASTFAELITAYAAIQQAPSPEERLRLLDEKISNSVSYLMDIHARFLFEFRFYEQRRKGPLRTSHVNEIMQQAQEEAFHYGLEAYLPSFWASKVHYYVTHEPFYNFPYTFGFLFSAGIYARAREEGPSFERKYVELLRDTGRTWVEDLAMRHLGADLTQPDFWLSGVKLMLGDVEEFLRLTEGV